MRQLGNRKGRTRGQWGTRAALVAGAWLASRTLRTRYSFRGKVVIVSGGSRGLGLALARRLADEGARLALCARDAAELERAREELAGRGAEVLTEACDVSDRGQVEAFVNRVRETLGDVDVLINNAGVIQVGPAETMRLSDYHQAMGVHFFGPLHFIQAVTPSMRARGAGRIVNITSIGGKVPAPHLLPYDASKFALVGLSEGLHAELLKDGIRVTTVVPGLMRTGSPRNALFKGQHRLEYAWFAVADSLPLLTIGVDAAARRILEAARAGRAELILTLAARAAARVHGMFPGLTTGGLALANLLLPPAGGIGAAEAKGRDSESSATRVPWLNALRQRAAERQNEVLG